MTIKGILKSDAFNAAIGAAVIVNGIAIVASAAVALVSAASGLFKGYPPSPPDDPAAGAK